MISSSGPGLFADGTASQPAFWVGIHGDSQSSYKPLVLSWKAHNRTVLMPDPGFLMTYGLGSSYLRVTMLTSSSMGRQSWLPSLMLQTTGAANLHATAL